MTIRITRPVVVKGFPGAGVGDVLEVPAGIAGDLLGLNAAVECKAVEAVEPVQTREPEIENREPEIRTTKRSKKTLP